MVERLSSLHCDCVLHMLPPCFQSHAAWLEGPGAVAGATLPNPEWTEYTGANIIVGMHMDTVRAKPDFLRSLEVPET